MSDKSAIEWTDSTWNPVTGCTKISPGCKNCYAERFAERWRGTPNHPYEQGFDLRLWPDRLRYPLEWKKPRMIFVNSMSDLFHKDVPDEFVLGVFAVMYEARQHVFQVLTKRPERMLAWFEKHYSANSNLFGGKKVPKHIWLGASVESEAYAGRIDYLKKVPAEVRFLSVEPLLGPVNLTTQRLRGIHWVIVGGESGPGARPMNPMWAKNLRDQCRKSKVPFFFKQWGAYNDQGQRKTKKAAGRILDGRTWDELPSIPGLEALLEPETVPA